MRIGRIFSYLILALGVGLLCWRLIPVIQGGAFKPDPLGKLWFQVHANSLELLQPAIERHIAPWLWSDVVQPVLEAPAFLDFMVLGAVLLLIFRRRRKSSKAAAKTE